MHWARPACGGTFNPIVGPPDGWQNCRGSMLPAPSKTTPRGQLVVVDFPRQEGSGVMAVTSIYLPLGRFQAVRGRKQNQRTSYNAQGKSSSCSKTQIPAYAVDFLHAFSASWASSPISVFLGSSICYPDKYCSRRTMVKNRFNPAWHFEAD